MPSNKLPDKSKHRQHSFFYKKLASIRSSLIAFFNSTLRKPLNEHENELVNINLRAQDIFIVDNNSSFLKTQLSDKIRQQAANGQAKENPICKIPFKLNSNDYYDYEDIFTYFKTNNYAASMVPFKPNTLTETNARSSGRFLHILYDIPEEDSDCEDDDDDEDVEDYKCNLDEILKI